MTDATGREIFPTDPQVAKQVHDDIWDLFGHLTREQSAALTEYLEALTRSGIIQMPKMGTIGTPGPTNPGEVSTLSAK